MSTHSTQNRSLPFPFSRVDPLESAIGLAGDYIVQDSSNPLDRYVLTAVDFHQTYEPALAPAEHIGMLEGALPVTQPALASAQSALREHDNARTSISDDSKSRDAEHGGASEDADSIELLLTANLVPAAVQLMQDTIVDWDVSASHPPNPPPLHVMFVQHLQRLCWAVHIFAGLLIPSFFHSYACSAHSSMYLPSVRWCIGGHSVPCLPSCSKRMESSTILASTVLSCKPFSLNSTTGICPTLYV